jgi:DNA polymerase-3 subunit delta'
MLNQKTKFSLEKMASNIPQSLIFYGEKGVDFSSAISYLYGNECKILNVLPQKNGSGNFLLSVDQIRDLYNIVNKKRKSNQVIAIYNAELMTKQAQNTFLKIFEEPPTYTYILLLCNDLNKIIDTIKSRAQLLRINKLNNVESAEVVDKKNKTDNTKSQQILFIANGLPDFIEELSKDKKLFEKHSNIIHDAKIFLQGTAKDKIVLINSKYKDSRENAEQLMKYIIKMLRIIIKNAPSIDYISFMDRAIETEEKLESNCNVRLSMLYFVVEWL